jgi:hypothetical protein
VDVTALFLPGALGQHAAKAGHLSWDLRRRTGRPRDRQRSGKSRIEGHIPALYHERHRWSGATRQAVHAQFGTGFALVKHLLKTPGRRRRSARQESGLQKSPFGTGRPEYDESPLHRRRFGPHSWARVGTDKPVHSVKRPELRCRRSGPGRREEWPCSSARPKHNRESDQPDHPAAGYKQNSGQTRREKRAGGNAARKVGLRSAQMKSAAL